MSWVKLDDLWDDHPKFSELGDLEHLLWVKGLTYACRHKTHGVIPSGRIQSMLKARGAEKLAGKLVTAGLWIKTEGGYRIHDYDKYQQIPDRLSEARRDAGKLGAASRWQADGKSRLCHDDLMASAINVDGKTDGKDLLSHAGPHAYTRADARRVGSGEGSEIQEPEENQSRAVAECDDEINPLGAKDLCAQAYARGIAEAGGQPWAMLNPVAEIPAMMNAGFLHWPQKRGEQLADAIRRSAFSYRKAMADKAEFQSGFSTLKWAKWLNEGRPGASPERKIPSSSTTAKDPVPTSEENRAGAELARLAVQALSGRTGMGGGAK